MANIRECDSCAEGKPSQCEGRFQAASRRTELSCGTKPKRPVYTYRCPNEK